MWSTKSVFKGSLCPALSAYSFTSTERKRERERESVYEGKIKMPRPQRKFIDILEKSMVVADTMDREDLMFTYKGIPYPTTLCSYEVFKAMESFEARSDDMILAGFPKSGTNWFGHILLELITTFEKKTEVEPTIYGEEFDEFPYLEIGDTEKYQRMKKIPFRRVIRTHLMSQNLPKSVFTNKAKILLLLRNPKDLATSFFKFSKVMAPFPTYDDWDEFFKDFMIGNIPWGSYFTYLSEWNKHADDEHVMPITFEEVKENPLLGVKKIAKFFELPLTEEELKGVAERSSFQAMKNNSKETHGVFGNVLFRKGYSLPG
ncbi:PREDICTED: sulfotransferase 6B1-like isoform X3 [Gavialis gangeticus]|uniref:sulfotransferase 6B1-like isoform X3 n=1 Tax=Gavialis gangeticus TaxID=94835 RepID=UPI00092E941C|nr:PREDICTED: sulfotransferase 6B1-like isoform X3 [Gavialis gangeticus]